MEIFECQILIIKIFQLFNLLKPGDIDVSANVVIIGSGNGLAPVWCQAITWTNADLLSIGPSPTNSCEI